MKMLNLILFTVTVVGCTIPFIFSSEDEYERVY